MLGTMLRAVRREVRAAQPRKARLEGPPEAYSELLLASSTAARKREIVTAMKQQWEVLLKLEQRFRVHPS